MTTLTQELLLPRAEAVSKPSSALRWLRAHWWGLFDQVLISGSNFVTMVLAARAMHPDSAEFGQFSLVYSALLFANILQSTLVTQPHNVLGSTRSGESYPKYTSATGLSQVLLVIVLGMMALAVGGLGHWRGWTIAPLLVALAPSIVAWQLQELVRRVLYTEGRLSAAFVNDVISYGAQAVAVVALFQMRSVTGSGILYILAITSFVAAAVGVWQIRGSLSRHVDLYALVENWQFGKWLTGAELLGWCSSLHMYLYIAAVILGAAASGELKSAQILYGPARIFAFFLGTVLPIRFAKTHHAHGKDALHQQFKSTALLIAPAMGAYCLFVAFFGNALLRTLYQSTFAGSGRLLALYSLAAFLSYLLMFVSAALTATHRTRYIFMGYVYGSIIAFALSWPIIYVTGVVGAVICMILTATICNVLFWRVYLRQIARGEAVVEEQQGAEHEGSGEILTNLLNMLESNNIPYCLLHGWRDYPERISSDVDCLVPSWATTGLPQLLRAEKKQLGAELVQWLDDESPLLVLQGNGWLALHLTSAFKLNHLTFYSSEEILESRRRCKDMWVPAARVEFSCVLINRVMKGTLKPKHVDDLLSLWAEDRDGCQNEIGRFWSEQDVRLIVQCVETAEWGELRKGLARLRGGLLIRQFVREPLSACVSKVAAVKRRVYRFCHPNFGLHVVFLGPDGVGKSTVIEHVEDAIAPAFLKKGYHTFAPSLLPSRIQPKKSLPHELPPRSVPASLLKAAWWLVCYTLGYLVSVQLIRGRAGIVLGHRYLLDAIVDPKRYRYSGPTWWLKLIWKITPKPDLIVLLDAPAEVVQGRKKEVPFEETARQRGSYRALVEPLENGVVIDASQELAKVVLDVQKVILGLLRRRLAWRIGWEVRP